MKIRLPKFRPLRERRVRKLVDLGFDKNEAITLTKPRMTPDGKKIKTPIRLSSKATTGSAEATRLMIEARQQLMREAKAEGISKKKAIAGLYSDHGFFDKEGRRDPWEMFRFYYPGGRTTRKDQDPVKLAAQRKRQKERVRDRYGTPYRMPRGLTLREQQEALEEAYNKEADATRRQQLMGQHNKLRLRIERGEE